MKFAVAALAMTASLAGLPALAAETFPDVRNTSMVDQGGSRVLQLAIDLKAPPKAV